MKHAEMLGKTSSSKGYSRNDVPTKPPSRDQKNARSSADLGDRKGDLHWWLTQKNRVGDHCPISISMVEKNMFVHRKS